MKRWLMVIFILFITTAQISCYDADVSGLVSSSDVDKRFDDSASLPEKTSLSFNDDSFSFIVISDTHILHASQTYLPKLPQLIIPEDKFILVCGDLSQCGYAEDFQAFCDYLNQTKLPYFCAIGNHDLYNSGWQYYKQFLGKACFSVTAGPIRLISLDSANGTLGSKQKNWLENVLKTKTEPLCFVMTHFEFFSPGFNELQQYTDIEEVYYLMHLFETNKVNYAFMGHSHANNNRVVNNVDYLNVADFQDNGGHKYYRVYVNHLTVTFQSFDL